MRINFDQHFGDFTITNFHRDPKVIETINAKLFLKTYDELFIKFNH